MTLSVALKPMKHTIASADSGLFSTVTDLALLCNVLCLQICLHCNAAAK